MGGGPHTSLVSTAAFLATAIGLAAVGYGWATGLYLLKALALILLASAHGSWLALGAARLRRLYGEAELLLAEQQQGRTPLRNSQEDKTGAIEKYEVVFSDVEHGRKLFYLFGAIIPAAVIGVIAASLLYRGVVAIDVVQTRATALGIVCLAVSSLWLVLWRTFGAISDDEQPEARFLCLSFREAQWATLLAAFGILARLFRPEVSDWIGGLLLGWLLLVMVEFLVRLLKTWLRPAATESFVPSLRVFLRELVLSQGNPVSSLFQTIETRFGVSFRSSWAIRFVKNAALPTLLLAAMLFWALSSLAMVGPSEMGIRESLGVLERQTLRPGLHLKLPWPLGRVRRYPVKRVFSQAVGFVATDEEPAAFLWSNVHAKEEFEVVLGDGTEAVAVNAVLYYKIREDDRLYDYALRFDNPTDALEGYAYRALMEQTRSATLEEVLSANRGKFVDALHRAIQQYADENRLGIDVVEVALLNLHPPTEAAESYLDVISARIDAERFQIEARGQRIVRFEEAETDRTSAVAEAQVKAARRVANAIKESAEFVATGMAYAVSPEAFIFRVRGDNIAEIISRKPLILIDRVLASGPGEVLLDLREAAGTADPITSGVD